MPLLYIHDSSCISPQQSFPVAELDQLTLPFNSKLEISEPRYDDIPAGILRRMGKAIRIGIGSAMPLLKHSKADGIIIGTGHGGMEDSIKFLNQIIDYKEGRLTPGNFVASTPNAIAAQVGLLTANQGYNITHVQDGLSFENALLDAAMLISENANNQYLVGGVDEISSYNYNIDWLNGWYKAAPTPDFYDATTTGSLAGEGSAMFMVNGRLQRAKAQLDAIHFFHTTDAEEIAIQLAAFMEKHLGGRQPGIFLTGENGDGRYLPYYTAAESLMHPVTTIARYKHMCGEYATSSAFAFWLSCEIIQTKKMPLHMIKRQGNSKDYESILIYNHYKEVQHSFILLRNVNL